MNTDLFPSPRSLDDLHWRFSGEAEAEMGLRSNLGGFLALIERGLGSPGGADVDMSGRAIAAATRARLIDQALAAAGPVRGHRTIDLARLHFADPGPAWTLGGCGPIGSTPYLTPLLERIREAAAAHERSRSRLSLDAWLQRLSSKMTRGSCSGPDARLGEQLRQLGELVVAETVVSYGQARRGFRRAA